MTIIGSIQYLARSVVFGGIILTATMGCAYAAQASADHDLDYWQALSHTHYIEEGSKGPILYDFFDPNCPYCHQIYTWLQNPIDNGQLRVRFIVVGFLTHSS
ncbi:MAG: thiol:disulfide interchange protein, partial [Acidithiobacillus ferrivorans]